MELPHAPVAALRQRTVERRHGPGRGHGVRARRLVGRVPRRSRGRRGPEHQQRGAEQGRAGAEHGGRTRGVGAARDHGCLRWVCGLGRGEGVDLTAVLGAGTFFGEPGVDRARVPGRFVDRG